MNADRIDQVSRSIICRVFVVSNTPGAEFLENIYENAWPSNAFARPHGAAVLTQFNIDFKISSCARTPFAIDPSGTR
jgi:hypothetical protein